VLGVEPGADDAWARILLLDAAACARSGRAEHLWRDASAPGASFAALAHVHDLDDLHWGSLTHPGAIVWGSVLDAWRDAPETTLEDAIRAATHGYEITARLGSALGAEHRAMWHSTATAGAVGAAFAAGVIFGLSEDALVEAVGHAVSGAGGSAQCLVERSGSRVFHRFHAVAGGVTAARFARAGLPATRFGLEGLRGLFAATAPGSDPLAVLVSAGNAAITATSLRMYRTSGFNQTAVEAALALGPIELDRIESVTVHVAPAVAAVSSNRSPASADEAWWSVEAAVAGALVDGHAGGLRDGWRRREVGALLGRTAVVPDQGGHVAAITVATDRGAAGSAASVHLGEPSLPPTVDALRARWKELAGADVDVSLLTRKRVGRAETVGLLGLERIL